MIFWSLPLKIKKWLLLFLALLFAWWVFSASATCSAQEVYQITEAELTTLETNLNRLQQISLTQKQELNLLKEQLTKSQQELNLLKSRLATSKQQMTKAEESLQNANQLLQEYAEEEKRTRLRIKAQRNTWLTASVLLAVALVMK